jgi:phosphonate transport system substrate-binding protein
VFLEYFQEDIKSMSFKKTLTLVVIALLALTTVSAVNAQDVGSEDNPIQVYFVPSAEAQVLVEGGAILEQFLEEQTGLSYEVSVPTSYAATIEAMCADTDNAMGFIPGAGYVIGNNRCGIEAVAKAIRFGWSVYWAQILVRRTPCDTDDTPIYTIGDLEGRSWAYPDTSSTSGYIVPATFLASRGITVGEQVEAGSHNNAALAVYNCEADFATTFFSPPLMPGASWSIGDLPEPYDLTVDESYTTTTDTGSTRLWVGDIRILDARSSVASTAPDIVNQVRILSISDPIPNDTLSFGPDFPADLRQEIVDALFAFSESECATLADGTTDPEAVCWNNSALSTAYTWTGIELTDDSEFANVRAWFSVLGLTEDDIFGG